LNPQWGNTATKITTVKIPKGTTIYEGFAEQQIIVKPGGGIFTLQGGGIQIYVPEPKISWFLD
jgi:filamentous hemagglutinin